ncbi:MAG: 4a-hydroxytetrahydrobiopterin dehydratase [Saprospiraceae bacterium]|nr:4a-hydroxytetrahydrobiopterin dehydratase [Saprospiraceae bacterium]
MSRVALLSEKLNHHAHWLAVYNKVSLSLQTHESGGITEKTSNLPEWSMILPIKPGRLS